MIFLLKNKKEFIWNKVSAVIICKMDTKIMPICNNAAPIQIITTTKIIITVL